MMKNPYTLFYALVVLGLMIVGAFISVSACTPAPSECKCTMPEVPTPPTSCTVWEYKTQHALPKGKTERRGDGGLMPTSITPSADDLNALGKEGWEVVGTYMEYETAYAQVSEKELEPNVRPQRLVLIFRRPGCPQE